MLFLKELSAWLEKDRFAPKVLFCRGEAVGNQLLRMAAHSGTPVVNTRGLTVRQYMSELADPVLIAQGVRQIDRVTSAIALREIMENHGDAFTTMGVVEHTTAEAVLPQLYELERNSVRPDQLESVGSVLLAQVWQEHSDWKQANGYASLTQILDAASPEDNVSYAILSNLQLTQMEEDFIRKIPADRLTVINVEAPYGAEKPRGMVLQNSSPGNREISQPECVDCQDISVEIRAAFQYLVENGIPAEDAVLVCPDNAYGLRVEEEGKLLGLQVDSSFGVPASMTKTALLIRCLIDWAQRNYDVEALQPALISGAMGIYDDQQKLRMMGQEMLRIFRSRAVGWGKERWLRLGESERDRDALAGRLMTDWVGLFETNAIPVRDCAIQITRLLKWSMIRGVENEFYLNIIDEISRIYSGSMNALDYLTMVESIAVSFSVDSHTAESPGRVYCCSYENAMYVDRKHFIMLGMNWNAFDRRSREFPLLHDREKEVLSPRLRLAGDSSLDRRYAVKELLANRPDASVLFSMARMDHVGGEELLPASVFSEALRRYPNEKAPQINILDRNPLTNLDVHLQSGYSPEDYAPTPLPERGPLWQCAFENKVWSATDLEKAITCPRSYVLSSHMGIHTEDPVGLEQYGSAWLSSTDRGSLIHRVLERYFSADASREGTPDGVLLETLLDRTVAEFKQRIPVPVNLTDLKPEIDGILKILRQEVQLYANESSRKTIGTEISFGREEPLEMTFGKHVIRIKGYIDRVDIVGDEIEIIDYKSGKPGRFRKDFDHKLQYYLYSLAWEKLHPDQHVSRARYDLLDGAGGIELIVEEMTEEKRALLYGKVTELLDQMADPERSLTPTPALSEDLSFNVYEQCPGYCPFINICMTLFG